MTYGSESECATHYTTAPHVTCTSIHTSARINERFRDKQISSDIFISSYSQPYRYICSRNNPTNWSIDWLEVILRDSLNCSKYASNGRCIIFPQGMEMRSDIKQTHWPTCPRNIQSSARRWRQVRDYSLWSVPRLRFIQLNICWQCARYKIKYT